MTTPSLAEQAMLRLGDQSYPFTPVLAVVRRSGELQEVLDRVKKNGPLPTGLSPDEAAQELERRQAESDLAHDLVSEIFRRGTQRDTPWEQVREHMEDFTFPELVNALETMIQEREAEVDFMTPQPPTDGSASKS